MKWKESDSNHVATSLSRSDAEGLSRELGVATSEVEGEISEMRECERIGRMVG